MGSTAPIREVSREQFSYWCLNLLLLICSETSKGKVPQLLGDISERCMCISLLRSWTVAEEGRRAVPICTHWPMSHYARRLRHL